MVCGPGPALRELGEEVRLRATGFATVFSKSDVLEFPK